LLILEFAVGLFVSLDQFSDFSRSALSSK